MSIFDMLQGLIGDAAGSAQESVGGVVEGATTAAEGATEAASPIIELGQTAVDEVKQNLNL